MRKVLKNVNKMSKNEMGITLIALVVTIVVLLILAGVSISMLGGENGIITQAQDAKNETKIGAEKEAISVAYSGCKIDYINSLVPSAELQKELIANGNNVTVEGTEELTITFLDTNNQYTIEQETGKIEYQKPLTPEEAEKIVSAGLISSYIYAETAGGEVRLIEAAEQTAIDELDTTGATILTTNGIREKGKNYLIDKKGKVYTWGYNGYGQLGNGTTEASSNPICISEIEGNALKGVNIFDIKINEDTVIARDEEGKVYTWGRNQYGQLGNGTSGISAYSAEPICISDLANALKEVNIIEIETDGNTVIARGENGKVYSWGGNWNGQVGNGITEASAEPICISEIEGNALKGVNVLDIKINEYTVIARDKNGKVYTWGDNDYGQLGIGTTDKSSEPICISEIEGNALKGVNVLDIKINEYTVIARDKNGKVYTWGDNDYGQLGNGTTEASSNPICISETEGNALKGVNVLDIKINEDTVIARDDEGKVYTWGNNWYGQLGNGTTEASSNPICISEIEGNALKGVNIIDIETDKSTVIARDEDGKVYAWGSNGSGQFGNGPTESNSSPICISDSTIMNEQKIEKFEVDSYRDSIEYIVRNIYVYISTNGTVYKYYYCYGIID